MASNIQDLRGYDHQFVEKYSDGLICLICLCVARDPQQITCCGKLLCKACLEEYKKGSNNCPQCGVHISTFDDKKSNIS
jgi:TNF receptor-associated factor 4